MAEFVPPATRFVDLPAEFPMRLGGVLHGARVGYETVGELTPARDNVVLLLTGLSPSAHVATHPDDPTPGWWEAMVGPGKPIDTNRWHVVCVNSLGSCMGSTGPPSPDPATGEPYRLRFPELSIEDIADAAAWVVHALGYEHLACVVGTSMGGMSALALLSRHPDLARNHVNISSAVHSLPFSIAVRSLQREAIRTDPRWDLGRYHEKSYPDRGMRMARKLGMMTYRSAEEWNVRFGRSRVVAEPGATAAPFGVEFEVERYLELHAQRFARRFDPNSYLYLSRGMDWFDLGKSCECAARSCECTAEDALASLCLDNALVIGVRSDLLFPLRQQRQIAEGLSAGSADVEFLALESPLGHDAFLVDTTRFGPPVSKFLSEL
ncbi:homoserine O-acetyltransferase MetX [Actinosynnema sp. CA-299493]